MKPSQIRTLWAQNKPVVNGWLSIANSFSAEIVAAQGYDSVTIDTQHGLIDYADSIAMMQAIQGRNVDAIVRVPWLDPAAIMKSLDAGAAAIICPMINNREQAEAFVSYLRYPPEGTRSFGPARAVFSHGSDYYSHANKEVIALAMIETAEAVSNLESIASTPGLDGLYIGPADLTLGVTNGRLPPGFDRTEPEMEAVILDILAAANSAGIRACMHCGSPEYAKRAVDWGFSLVTLLNDVRMLSAAAAKSVSDIRQLLGEDDDGGVASAY